jgi:hypothetical protein
MAPIKVIAKLRYPTIQPLAEPQWRQPNGVRTLLLALFTMAVDNFRCKYESFLQVQYACFLMGGVHDVSWLDFTAHGQHARARSPKSDEYL